MKSDYNDFVNKARAAAADQRWQEAFNHLRWVFRDPELPGDNERFVESVGLLATIGGAIAGDEFYGLAHAAADSPDSPEALYDLGYELCENQLFEVAACVLTRSNRLAPGSGPIVSELAHSLECDGQNSAACSILAKEKKLLEENNILRYLLAFNSMMCGDLKKVRDVLPSLDRHDDESCLLVNRIEAMLHRANVVRDVCPLDARDLRGWHFVINGGLLLHISPFGFDEGMNGRYAFTQDSPNRCRDGVLRLQAALQAANINPKQVISLPDRDSQILSTAAAQILALDTVSWKPRTGLRRFISPKEGIVIGYDLRNQTEETLVELKQRHPNQLLYVHATCWTDPPPVCPDFTTYLYQTNQSPWQERISLVPDKKETFQKPPDNRPIKEIAREIVFAARDDEETTLAADSRDALMTSASAMLNTITQSKTRERVWEGGPVKSSRFL